jgi:hypothetical protein
VLALGSSSVLSSDSSLLINVSRSTCTSPSHSQLTPSCSAFTPPCQHLFAPPTPFGRPRPASIPGQLSCLNNRCKHFFLTGCLHFVRKSFKVRFMTCDARASLNKWARRAIAERL